MADLIKFLTMLLDAGEYNKIKIRLNPMVATVRGLLMLYQFSILAYGSYFLSFCWRHHHPKIIDLCRFAFGLATNWNIVGQTVFLTIAFACDILELKGYRNQKLYKRLITAREYIFRSVVVPLTLFVAGMFWSLYAVDRDLVFPKAYEKVVPWWFNQCVHTNILIILAVETILHPRTKPYNMKMELIILIILNVSYAIVYYTIYFITGRWLYNVFAKMTWWQICLFQLLIFASGHIFHLMQYPISRSIHGKNAEERILDSRKKDEDEQKKAVELSK